MDTKSTSSRVVHCTVPVGSKENTYYLIENERNEERRRAGVNNVFDDDCTFHEAPLPTCQQQADSTVLGGQHGKILQRKEVSLNTMLYVY